MPAGHDKQRTAAHHRRAFVNISHVPRTLHPASPMLKPCPAVFTCVHTPAEKRAADEARPLDEQVLTSVSTPSPALSRCPNGAHARAHVVITRAHTRSRALTRAHARTYTHMHTQQANICSIIYRIPNSHTHTCTRQTHTYTYIDHTQVHAHTQTRTQAHAYASHTHA